MEEGEEKKTEPRGSAPSPRQAALPAPPTLVLPPYPDPLPNRRDHSTPPPARARHETAAFPHDVALSQTG